MVEGMKIKVFSIRWKLLGRTVSLFIAALLVASCSESTPENNSLKSSLDDIDIMGTLYTSLGNPTRCVLHPLKIGNAGRDIFEFNRIHIEFKRKEVYRGEVIAQDIYFVGKQRTSRQYMQGMPLDQMSLPNNIKPSTSRINAGKGIANWHFTLYSCADYRKPNPAILEVTLFMDKRQVSKIHYVELPKRSSLTIMPNVKIKGITGGPGKELVFRKK